MKCIYKHDGQCCCTVSGKHLQQVTDEDCNNCDQKQEKKFVSEKKQIQELVEKALISLRTVIVNPPFDIKDKELILANQKAYDNTIKLLLQASRV